MCVFSSVFKKIFPKKGVKSDNVFFLENTLKTKINFNNGKRQGCCNLRQRGEPNLMTFFEALQDNFNFGNFGTSYQSPVR